ncbi:sensor histidine kinase [Fibrella sp. HMF5335]|uniref:Sensor histidine kinase n=2 Tax=Fibrella rubiginis TaxID=2817060 RepID=A0A939GDC5_9BACT|nr:sensor histidine kinase [Fibrella rubiginis]
MPMPLTATIVRLLLFFLLGPLVAVVAAEVPPIEKVKREIKQLQADKKYVEAAKAYEQLSWLYHQRYGYNKYTMDAYFNGLKNYSMAGDSLGYYNVHILIGNYYNQDYFMQTYAEKYLKQALAYFARTHNYPKVIECRLGIANIEEKKAPVSKTLIAQLRATEKMCILYKQPNFQAYALNLLADTYLRSKNPDSAQYFISRSLVLSKQLNVNWLIALNYFYAGIVNQFKNQHRLAIYNYQKSYALAEAEKNLSTLRELSRHMADSYSYLNDYENAYKISLKSLAFTNQFYYSQQTKSIRLQELDSQIKTLAVEKQLAEEQSSHQRIINTVLIGILFISALGVFALFFLRRQQKLIAHQQAVISQQQIRQLELKSLQAMIEGQEGERSRIARDLHDGLGIQLSRIKLFVEAHQDQLPLSVKDPLNQFLDEACTETRLISNNLRPYALSTFGLLPALEDLIQKLNLVNETSLVLEHYGDMPDLLDEASVMLYRVVQELLNNALKHAHAHTVNVQIVVNDEALLVSVDDDGRGGTFPDDAPGAPSKGNGISNIKSRIAYLGGQVMWQSTRETGTSVMISLPMQKLVKTSPMLA